MADLKLAAQLYTARDAAAADMPALLEAVRQIGYTGVELAGYGSCGNAAAVRQAIDAAGLAVSGSHVSLDDLTGRIDAVIQDQKTLGNTEAILPWVGDEHRRTAGDWTKLSKTLNTAGKKLAKAGVSLSYHNHAFEFDLFDGQTGMNLLLQHTDPAAVGFEVDVYWVAHAGHDPVPFLESLGSRLRLVHLKDRAADGKFAPVGTGTLDFAHLCKTATQAGALWGAVEQDDCYGQDPLKVLETGYKNLHKLGYA